MRFLYRKKISFIQNFLNKAVFKKELTFQQLLCGIVIDSGIVANFCLNLVVMIYLKKCEM